MTHGISGSPADRALLSEPSAVKNRHDKMRGRTRPVYVRYCQFQQNMIYFLGFPPPLQAERKNSETAGASRAGAA